MEYDLLNSSTDDLRLISSERIEQSAVPQCFAWYPPIVKENFLVVANDQVLVKEFMWFRRYVRCYGNLFNLCFPCKSG